MAFRFELEKSKSAQAIYEYLTDNPGGKSIQDICVATAAFNPETIKTFLGHLVIEGFIRVEYVDELIPQFGIPRDSENIRYRIDMNTGVYAPILTSPPPY